MLHFEYRSYIPKTLFFLLSMVWEVSALRRRRLLHFRVSEGTGRRGKELGYLQKVRRSRGCPVHLYTSLPCLSCLGLCMTLNGDQGQLTWASPWPLTSEICWWLYLTFLSSVISVSPSSVYQGQYCFWWKRLMSFLVGDTLFQQGWWLWMQGLEQVFSSVWHLRIWLHFYLINSHFLYVATDSGFPFYKGYVKGFLVVWILVNCCKKEKWGPGI